MVKIKNIFLLILACLLLVSCKSGAPFSKYKAPLNEAKTGDVIFQKLPSELSQVISEVQESELAHCGMIIKEENGDLKVIEAIGPVRIVPIEEFISHGIDKKYALVSFKDKSFDKFDEVVKEAKKFLGRPYDFLYQFDDEYIYCSELVYKAYFNAAKLKIAKTVKLKDLNYKDNVEFIKSLTGGGVPLDREMVTPVDIYRSEMFEKRFTNFE